MPTACNGKVTEAGESDTSGPVPVPDRLTLCGPPGALSGMDNAAVRLPISTGANSTVIEQVDPGARESAQVIFPNEKSLAFVPVRAMSPIVTVLPPILVTVIFCAALAVPSAWLGKVKEFGEIETDVGPWAASAVTAEFIGCKAIVAQSDEFGSESPFGVRLVPDTNAVVEPMAIPTGMSLPFAGPLYRLTEIWSPFASYSTVA